MIMSSILERIAEGSTVVTAAADTSATAGDRAEPEQETREAATEVGDQEPAAKPKAERGLQDAVTAEREKRQRAEQDAQRYQRGYQELQQRMAWLEGRLQAPAEKKPPEPTQEEIDNHLWEHGFTATVKKYGSHILGLNQQSQFDPVATAVAQSDAWARANVEGYPEARAAYMEARQQNPQQWDAAISAHVRQGGDASAFIRQQGRILMETKGVASIDDYRQRIESGAIEKYKAELKAKGLVIPGETAAIKPTTGTAAATSQRVAAPQNRPTISRMASGHFV
jgi:hypothetical protein